MRGRAVAVGVIPETAEAPPPALLPDLRFAALLGADAWRLLPPAVRRRFAERLGPGASVTYVGRVASCRMTAAGRLLAQACRLIGAPLPLRPDEGAAAVVTVTEDARGGGQVWTRLYAGARGFPQVIHSAKRFAGPTGLEEYLGGGFGVALAVGADGRAIRFASDHYFLLLAGRRLRLPRWLAPGRLGVDHEDLGDGRFRFTLSLTHRLLGEVIRQVADFRDAHFRDGEDAR